MHFLKKVIRGLGAYSFRASLFSFAILLGMVLTFGAPGVIKNTLNDSDIYQTPVTDLLDTDAIEANTDPSNDLNLSNPHVKQAAESTLNNERKQEITETIIDGTYSWLNREAKNPDFRIDFNPDREVFITQLTNNAFDRIRSLEPCTTQQILTLQEIDPFTVPCKPPANLEAEKQKFVSELQNNEEFLGDPVFSGEAALNEFKRHDTAGVADNIPTLFQLFTKLPLIFAVLAIISGAIVFTLADSKAKGINKLGKLLIETAISLVITSIVLYFVIGGIRTSLATHDSPELNQSIVFIVENLRDSIITPTAIATVVYFILGVIIIVTAHKRQRLSTTDNNPTTNA
jgi:uncharacterized Tic20 family protein